MEYTEQQKEKIFAEICIKIAEGKSVRSVLRPKNMPSRETFYKWLLDNSEMADRYARACEIRTDVLFDEMLHIAFTTQKGTTVKTTKTGEEVTTGDMLGHRKLKIDTLKWQVSKMNPTKYGDRLDLTSKGDKLQGSASAVKVEIIKPDFDD